MKYRRADALNILTYINETPLSDEERRAFLEGAALIEAEGRKNEDAGIFEHRRQGHRRLNDAKALGAMTAIVLTTAERRPHTLARQVVLEMGSKYADPASTQRRLVRKWRQLQMDIRKAV